MIILVDTVLMYYNIELDRWIQTDHDTWPFQYENGKLVLQSRNVQFDAPTLDDAFNRIKGYFNNTSYRIVDIRRGI